jgi:molecular chaperone DnaK (HSP70)
MKCEVGGWLQDPVGWGRQATNKEQTIRIESSGGLTEDQIQRMVREADQYASADKERRAAIEAKNEAETLIYSAEKNVSEYKDKVRARLAHRVHLFCPPPQDSCCNG